MYKKRRPAYATPALTRSTGALAALIGQRLHVARFRLNRASPGLCQLSRPVPIQSILAHLNSFRLQNLVTKSGHQRGKTDTICSRLSDIVQDG